MLKQDFLKAVVNQQELPLVGKNQLHKIVEKHPYFQSAYLLLAKKASSKNAYDKEVALAKAAAYAGDRAILCQLWNGKSVDEQEDASMAQDAVLPKGIIEEEVNEVQQKNRTVSKDDAMIQKSEQQLNRVIEQQTNELGDDTASYEFNYEEHLKNMVKQDTPTEQIEIDRQRFLEKARQQVEQELQTSEEQEETDYSQNQLSTEDVSHLIQKEAKELIAKEEVDTNIDQLKEELGLTVVDEEEGVWDIDEDASTEKQEHLIQDLKRKIEAFKRKKQFDNWLSGDKEGRKDDKKTEGRSISGIRDEDLKAYLAEQKKYKDKNDLSVEQQEKQSIQDTSNFISETMAKVFARQGQYERAIRIYQQLSLKYPEKNTYFAAKIEELKNKL